MRKGNPYLGGGRYIQNKGASALLGSELKRLGATRAFILGGHTALSIALGRIEPGLNEESIAYSIEEFAGHCTIEKCGSLREKAAAFGADMIVGIGGGKALDTAKMVANGMNLGVVTIPTSAATCAAFAVLSVIYAANGDVQYIAFLDREVQCVLVDTNIMVSHCPARMLASGIADAVAKYPEIAFSMDYSADWEKSVLPSAALTLSKFTWDLFEKTGAKAIADVREMKHSAEVEDVLCTGVALTGTVSSLISGGRQLAVAHTFYDGVCKHFKAQQKRFLHGEIVSAGILLQLHVNRAEPEQIDRTRTFLRSLGTPVSLFDLGIEPGPGNIDPIFTYIRDTMNLGEDWMNGRLRSGLEGILARRD